MAKVPFLESKKCNSKTELNVKKDRTCHAILGLKCASTEMLEASPTEISKHYFLVGLCQKL